MAEAIRADVAWRLARALAPEEGNGQSQVGTATVTRVDADGTVWVRIPGSVIDTPANGTVTAAAEPGQTVGYRIESGRLSVTGNVSSPAVGGTYVTQVVEPVERKADEAMDEAWRAHIAADAAEMDARRAKGAADAAQESADDAADAAESAQQSAATANRAANDALTQLSFVEDVAGTLDWIQSHGTFTATTDTTIQEGKVYFELVSGDYVPVASPSGNPSQQGWYELDVTDSQTDYIMAHLAVTSAGLWVLPSGIDGTDAQHSSGYKALLANDGMRVYDGDGTAVATYGESVTFADDRDWQVGSTNAYVRYSAMGDTLVIGGPNVSIGGNAPSDLATKVEASQMAQPNLAPLFSVDFSDRYDATDNPDGYWRSNESTQGFTQLDDGWAHYEYDNTSGSALKYNYIRPGRVPSIVPGNPYTILLEIRNNAPTGTSTHDTYLQQIANNQFWGNVTGDYIDAKHVTTTTMVDLLSCGTSFVRRSYRLADVSHLADDSGFLFTYAVRTAVGATNSFDLRMSIYEGIYDGPYKPYAGSVLYATQTNLESAKAAIKVTTDGITSEVEKKTDKATIISTINQSAETIQIQASKVEITGEAVFSAINDDTGTTKINGGKIDAESITIGGSNLATQSYVGTAVDTIEVGGRNLLRYRVYDYADANSVVGVNSAYRGMYCAVDGGEAYTVSRRVIEGNRFWIDWSEQEPAAGVALHSLSKDNAALKVTVDVPSEANWLFIYLSNQSDVISDGNIKVERGNKATDWTPAPEDVDADISAAQQAAIDAIPDPTDFYGTCSTAAGTAAKVVVCNGFVADTGTRLTVKFSTASTQNVPTLTIKDSTEAVLMSATAVWFNNVVASSSNPVRWGVNATLHFVYNGTVWVLDEKPPSYSTTSSTAATTRAKAAAQTGALVVNGTRVTVRFSTANTYVANSVQLNFASTGAYNIYRDNAVTSTTNTMLWDANTVLTFVAQGTYWYLADNGTRTMSEEAAKTATNYISADSSGIRIADADPATATTYQHQTATSTEFVVEGDSLLEMDGTNGVRVGDASRSHVLVDSDSMDIYDGANRAAGFSASFEEDADAGTSAAYATIEIGSDPNVALSSTRQDWGEGDTKAHISIHALADGADVESAVKASSYAETQTHLKGHSSATPHGDGGTYEYVSYDSSVTLAGQALIIDDQYSAGTRKYYYSMTDVASLLEKMLTPATADWTLATGVTSATIHSCRNNGVTLTIYGQNITLASSLAVGGQVTLGTVPEGFRPPIPLHVPALSYQSNVAGAIVQLTTAGVVQLTNRSSAAIATSTRIAFVATVTP